MRCFRSCRIKASQFADLREQLEVDWWQIPKEKVPQFVEALRRNKKSEFEDGKNMVARGIGLLTHNYKDESTTSGGMLLCALGTNRWVMQ